MNAPATLLHTLDTGQTLAIGSRRPQHLVVAEGEVELHRRPRWLAETVVQLPPVRVAAPACVPLDGGCLARALRRARIAVVESPFQPNDCLVYSPACPSPAASAARMPTAASRRC